MHPCLALGGAGRWPECQRILEEGEFGEDAEMFPRVPVLPKGCYQPRNPRQEEREEETE